MSLTLRVVAPRTGDIQTLSVVDGVGMELTTVDKKGRKGPRGAAMSPEQFRRIRDLWQAVSGAGAGDRGVWTSIHEDDVATFALTYIYRTGPGNDSPQVKGTISGPLSRQPWEGRWASVRPLVDDLKARLDEIAQAPPAAAWDNDVVKYSCMAVKLDGSPDADKSFAIVDSLAHGRRGLYVRTAPPVYGYEPLTLMRQELYGDEYASDTYDVSVEADTPASMKDRARIFARAGALVAKCRFAGHF